MNSSYEDFEEAMFDHFGPWGFPFPVCDCKQTKQLLHRLSGCTEGQKMKVVYTKPSGKIGVRKIKVDLTTKKRAEWLAELHKEFGQNFVIFQDGEVVRRPADYRVWIVQPDRKATCYHVLASNIEEALEKAKTHGTVISVDDSQWRVWSNPAYVGCWVTSYKMEFAGQLYNSEKTLYLKVGNEVEDAKAAIGPDHFLHKVEVESNQRGGGRMLFNEPIQCVLMQLSVDPNKVDEVSVKMAPHNFTPRETRPEGYLFPVGYEKWAPFRIVHRGMKNNQPVKEVELLGKLFDTIPDQAPDGGRVDGYLNSKTGKIKYVVSKTTIVEKLPEVPSAQVGKTRRIRLSKAK